VIDDLQVRDRVSRPKDLFDARLTPTRRYGSIVEVYAARPNGLGQGATLYAVHWEDTHTTARGYLRCGLELELRPSAPTSSDDAPRFSSHTRVRD